MQKEIFFSTSARDLMKNQEMWCDTKLYAIFHQEIFRIVEIEQELNDLEIPVADMLVHIQWLNNAIESLKSIDDKFIIDNLMDRPDIPIHFYRNLLSNIIESAEYVVNALRFPFEHLVELYDNEDEIWIAYEEANFPNQPAGE